MSEQMSEQELAAIMAEAEKILGGAIKKEGTSSTIGSTVVEWFKLKTQVDELSTQKTVLSTEMEILEYKIIEQMEAAEVEKISTTFGSVTLSQKSMPSAKDFFAFMTWIGEDLDNRIGFMQKRISDVAVNEYLQENGFLPPGIDTYIKPKLTKRKAK
jgi:hypothetical protein